MLNDITEPTIAELELQKDARLTYARAIKSKQLIRGTTCNRCGKTGPGMHGHHEDYTKPLEVEWLCARCHGLIHAAALGVRGGDQVKKSIRLPPRKVGRKPKIN